MTFLIVEDDRSVVAFLHEIFEAAGYHSLHAASTRQADLVLSIVVVDAITLDLGMPGPDTLNWLEEIALARPELARKTLVITGRDPDDIEIKRIEKAGAGLRLKPCPGTEILDFFERRFKAEKRDRDRRRRRDRQAPPLFEPPEDG